jgi:hypothetical protein
MCVSRVAQSIYGLDGQGPISGGGKGLSYSLCVEAVSGARPISCTMGTGGGVLSPGVICGRGVIQSTHPHVVPRLRRSRSYTSSSTKRLCGVLRTHFTLFKCVLFSFSYNPVSYSSSHLRCKFLKEIRLLPLSSYL